MFFEKLYASMEEVNEPLSPEQLRILRDQLESERPNVNPQSEFNYAWGLIKLDHHKQQVDGLRIMERLYKDVPELRRDCLYYLSLGSVKVGDYINARRYLDAMLKKEPNNSQALELKKTIDDKVTNDGLIGLGVLAGALAVGVGIAGALMRKKK